jgi:hypothetical protein
MKPGMMLLLVQTAEAARGMNLFRGSNYTEATLSRREKMIARLGHDAVVD